MSSHLTSLHSPRLRPRLETLLSFGDVHVLLLQSALSASLVAEAEREQQTVLIVRFTEVQA